MDSSDVLAGAAALPVVLALSVLEPALGLMVGFLVFVAVRKAPPAARRALALRRPRRATPRVPLVPRG